MGIQKESPNNNERDRSSLSQTSFTNPNKAPLVVLPQNWECIWSNGQQKWYFWNPKMGKTSWKPPPGSTMPTDETVTVPGVADQQGEKNRVDNHVVVVSSPNTRDAYSICLANIDDNNHHFASSSERSNSITSQASKTETVTSIIRAISDQYENNAKEEKTRDDKNEAAAVKASALATAPGPITSLSSAETIPISNALRSDTLNGTLPAVRSRPSSASTVAPPPVEEVLTRNQYLRTTPGAVPVSPMLTSQASLNTIQIGDDATHSGATTIVNAVLVRQGSSFTNNVQQHQTSQDQESSPPPPSVNAIPLPPPQPRSFWSMLRDTRVCSLVTLLLLVIAGLLVGLLAAFANIGGEGKDATLTAENQKNNSPNLVDDDETTTPFPSMMPNTSLRPTSFGFVTPTAPKPADDNNLEIKPSKPTKAPTRTPTELSAWVPTQSPTPRPNDPPVSAPTKYPTQEPTLPPTKQPSSNPVPRPTPRPTRRPTQPPINKVPGPVEEEGDDYDEPVDDFADAFVDDYDYADDYVDDYADDYADDYVDDYADGFADDYFVR